MFRKPDGHNRRKRKEVRRWRCVSMFKILKWVAAPPDGPKNHRCLVLSIDADQELPSSATSGMRLFYD
eukprot:scaffold3965_cov113-Skeletonema_dohrnii-CCMP3373.AAC.3